MITVNFTDEQLNALIEQIYSIAEDEDLDCDCAEGVRLRAIVAALGEPYAKYHREKQQQAMKVFLEAINHGRS